MRKKILKTSFFICYAGFLLILLEAALRIAGFGYPQFSDYDPVYGTSWVPGVRGLYTREGRAFVEINPAGFRDIKRGRGRKESVFRIAMLGDSFVAGFEVAHEALFSSVLEKELNSRKTFGDRTVEVLNFGVSGYGTGQEFLLLNKEVLTYHPDLVILAFTTGNDVRNNDRALEWDKTRPFFDLKSGKLERDDSFRRTEHFLRKTRPQYKLYRKIAFHLRMMQAFNFLKDYRKISALAEKGLGVAGELGMSDEVYKFPPGAEWEKAWDVTERLLKETKSRTDLAGGRFLLVSLSNGIQVYPDPERRQATAGALGTADLFYPERRLSLFARKAGIEYYPLAPDMLEYSKKTGVHLHGFKGTGLGVGHWNESGHYLAGKLLAEYLSGRRPR